MRELVFARFREFYVAAARRSGQAPAQGALAVVRDGSVLDLSAEAAAWGVRCGLPVRLARRRCPELWCIEHDPDTAAPLFHEVWSVFAELTPLIEPVDFHEGFLDLTGCIPRQRTLAEVVQGALWRIHFAIGIPGEWGGGADRWIARLAAAENRFVPAAVETDLLRRVPVATLGLEAELCERLARYNIRTAAELLAVPRSFLQSHLGLARRELEPYLLRSDAPVRALFPPREILLAVELNWGADEELRGAIAELTDRAVAELQAGGQQSGRVRVMLHSPRGVLAREEKPAKPVFLREPLAQLLEQIILRAQLVELRRIELTLGALLPRPLSQLELWQKTPAEAADAALGRARAALTRKYGSQSIQSGSEYARSVPPRFAQLIFARRGIPLP